MRRTLALAMLLTGFSAAFPASAQSTPTPKGGLRVTVHIFSGRRDPEFRITDPQEIAKVMAILRTHGAEDPQAGTEDVIGHRLGYRGISIAVEPGVPGAGDLVSVAVNRNRIQVRRAAAGASRATRHADAAAEMEDYLLERGMAQGQVDTQIVQRVHAR